MLTKVFITFIDDQDYCMLTRDFVVLPTPSVGDVYEIDFMDLVVGNVRTVLDKVPYVAVGCEDFLVGNLDAMVDKAVKKGFSPIEGGPLSSAGDSNT